MGEFVFKMNEPKDYEYLLLCDGSTISEENYPELVAVLGGTQLPNLIDRFLQGAGTAGTYKAAGLPNITGGFSGKMEIVSTPSSTGAFGDYQKGNSNQWVSNSNSVVYIAGYNFNASRSNSIYGSSTTVQPPAFTTKIYICYAG